MQLILRKPDGLPHDIVVVFHNTNELHDDTPIHSPYLRDMTLTLFIMAAVGLLVFLAVSSGDSHRTVDGQVIYVSLGGENRLATFDFDDKTGAMSLRSHVDLDGSPGPITVDSRKKVLYVGLREKRGVQALRLDDESSPLSLATTPMGLNPVYLKPDPAGRYLLAADYGSGEVVSYPILDRGVISESESQRFIAGKNPHSFYFDPAGRYAFVPVLGDDAIMQYCYDANAGTLTPNEPTKVSANKGDGPRHLAWHPNGRMVLCADEVSCTLTSYRFDSSRGTLTRLDRVSSLPAGYSGRNLSTADVHITRDGRFAYISNRGHDSLAGFAINENTGRLLLVGHTATEATPRAFSFDVTGKFIISAGQSSGRLAVYRLNPADGALQLVQTVEAGKEPVWVEAVPGLL